MVVTGKKSWLAIFFLLKAMVVAGFLPTQGREETEYEDPNFVTG